MRETHDDVDRRVGEVAPHEALGALTEHYGTPEAGNIEKMLWLTHLYQL